MKLVLKDCKEILTLKNAHQKDGRFLKPEDKGIIKNSSILCKDGKILAIDSWEKIKKKIDDRTNVIDCSNLCVTPELVDSHTHLVFGGNRAFEYTMRLDGSTYEEIANSGGGILHTMNQTNTSSREELFLAACKRIEKIHSLGVGTIEIKSGYGLNIEKEIELSEIIHDLKQKYKGTVQIFNTFMAAHAVPSNFKNSSEYLDEVVLVSLNTLCPRNILDAVDIFLEEGYFTTDDVKKLKECADQYSIPLKIHADEFVCLDGASLACNLGALSADHLLAINSNGIKSLSTSKTVATLLPGTGYFLGKPQCNARVLLDSGAKVSIASDFNPGSCHQFNLKKVACTAAPNYKMNSSELWSSITLNAAASLGKIDQGYIYDNAVSRFSFWKCNSLDEVIYNWDENFATRPMEYLKYLAVN